MDAEEYWNNLADELRQLWQDVRPLLEETMKELEAEDR